MAKTRNGKPNAGGKGHNNETARLQSHSSKQNQEQVNLGMSEHPIYLSATGSSDELSNVSSSSKNDSDSDVAVSQTTRPQNMKKRKRSLDDNVVQGKSPQRQRREPPGPGSGDEADGEGEPAEPYFKWLKTVAPKLHAQQNPGGEEAGESETSHPPEKVASRKGRRNGPRKSAEERDLDYDDAGNGDDEE